MPPLIVVVGRLLAAIAEQRRESGFRLRGLSRAHGVECI
jgi:hypothetical protein